MYLLYHFFILRLLKLNKSEVFIRGILSYYLYLLRAKLNNINMLAKAKKYKLSNKLIARYLGYSSEVSFANTSSKDRILMAIERIIGHVESKIVEDLSK